MGLRGLAIASLFTIRGEHLGQNAREAHQLMLMSGMQIGGSITFPSSIWILYRVARGYLGKRKLLNALEDLKPSIRIRSRIKTK